MGLVSCGDSFWMLHQKINYLMLHFGKVKKDVDMALNGCYKGWEAMH